MMTGNVLITGGSGFLGRGIMRRARRDGWEAKFTVLSRDEEKQAECRRKFPEATYILGDVLDAQRTMLSMLGHAIVIHAAALKFIPEGELNADEVVRVNIDGARAVIDAARAASVKRVVGISTDKAAQPINIYGMTKAVMERLFAEATDRNDITTFTTCRYGNVIGSTGSVVPVMQRQFRQDGFVRITDPAMTRFWMTVDDAVDTIVQALTAPAGTVVIPAPKAASMLDVAYAVLGSLDEDMHGSGIDDSRIQVIGARPGEKQHEDLVTHYEMFRASRLGTKYIALAPPGSENYALDEPTLSSNYAIGISRDDLLEAILDASRL